MRVAITVSQWRTFTAGSPQGLPAQFVKTDDENGGADLGSVQCRLGKVADATNRRVSRESSADVCSQSERSRTGAAGPVADELRIRDGARSASQRAGDLKALQCQVGGAKDCEHG